MARLECTGCGRAITHPSPHPKLICARCGEPLADVLDPAAVMRVVALISLSVASLLLYSRIDWAELLAF